MAQNQIHILALAQAPTLVAALIGIWTSNRHFNELDSRITGIENALARLESTIDRIGRRQTPNF